MSDLVHGKGFSFDCRIGLHDFERHIRQRVEVDWTAETDWRHAAMQDRADDRLIDYYKVNQALEALVANKEWWLLEALAEDVAHTLCVRFPVNRVRVKVTKLPFDMPNTQHVAVECERTPADFAGVVDPLERGRKG